MCQYMYICGNIGGSLATINIYFILFLEKHCNHLRHANINILTINVKIFYIGSDIYRFSFKCYYICTYVYSYLTCNKYDTAKVQITKQNANRIDKVWSGIVNYLPIFYNYFIIMISRKSHLQYFLHIISSCWNRC